MRELDKYIIGQDEAKRAVAIALRNRYRRAQLPPEMREEVTPKNILMVGPTGVGKTEIARRLAKLVDAPFVKVEATKFTEVGYVGRDVDSIIRDLVEASIRTGQRDSMTDGVTGQAQERAEERLIDLIIEAAPRSPPTPSTSCWATSRRRPSSRPRCAKRKPPAATRSVLQLREGKLEHMLVEVEVEEITPSSEIPGTDMNMNDVLGSIMPKKHQAAQGRGAARRASILVAEEQQNLIDMDSVYTEAHARAPSRTASSSWTRSTRWPGAAAGHGPGRLPRGRAARHPAHRRGLALSPPSTARSSTDHILFIAAGAFHVSKVSDLIPELQGRFPVRVELKPLTRRRLQAHPHPAGERAHPPVSGAARSVDGVALDVQRETRWTPSPSYAWLRQRAPPRTSARAGCTQLLEKMLSDIAFNAGGGDGAQVKVTIDAAYVESQLKAETKQQDLSRYIL